MSEERRHEAYSCDIQDYIKWLKEAVIIAHNHGVLVTDGCTHIELLEDVKNNTVNQPNEVDVRSIIDSIQAGINVDYVNVHTKFQNNTYTVDELKEVTDWLVGRSGGHVVMSNEWHMEDCDDTFVPVIIAEWRKCALAYCLIWDTGDVGGSITDGNGGFDSEGLGEAYANAIQ